jgi:hypothetical protein
VVWEEAGVVVRDVEAAAVRDEEEAAAGGRVREASGEVAKVVLSPAARPDSVFAQNAVSGNHTNEAFHAPRRYAPSVAPP